MERSAEIIKPKSTLVNACILAVVCTAIAIAEMMRDGGNAVWILLLLALFNYAMILDYFRSKLIITDSEIISISMFGRQKNISYDDVRSVICGRNFLFIYGKEKKMLASMDADIAKNTKAFEILKDRGVIVVYRKGKPKEET